MAELNELTKEIHENALEHGWWDEPRSYHVISGLFHSEIVEAVEADRKDEEFLWFDCKAPSENIKCMHCPVAAGIPRMDCPYKSERKIKPDGIAIELADCVIRILDYFGRNDIDAEAEINRAFLSDENRSGLNLNIDEFADYLHNEISKASMFTNVSNGEWLQILHLAITIKMIDEWLKMRRYDMMKLIKLKHEYNKTRPYKHRKRY